MAACTICSDSGTQENTVYHCTVSTVSPSICHEVIGPDAMIFIFWMVSFQPAFWLSSLTFIKRLFSFSLLSAIRVVSSPCLRLLIFLTAILIPACDSSRQALTMYSAYKLNKQDDNIQPWRTLFPNFEAVCCSMSSTNCCFLTRTQVSQEAGKVVWYSHLFQNFPVCVTHTTVKGFVVVNEAEVDVLVEFPCFFHDPNDLATGSLVSLHFLNLALCVH